MDGGMSIEMWLAERDDPAPELLRRVRDELARMGGLDTSAISVGVSGRSVTLTGTVPDELARIEAEHAAGRVTGVQAVTNELAVIEG